MYLLGDIDGPQYDEVMHPTDSTRAGIISFLEEYWTTLAPQLTCPAKMLKDPVSPNPRPCFECIDAQVVSCLISNGPKVEQMIILRRPKRGA